MQGVKEKALALLQSGTVDRVLGWKAGEFFYDLTPAVCQGCGACTVACMSGAMDLKGFSNKQIMAEVDAICR